MRVGASGATLVYCALGVLTVVALYFGKPVLMPIALATLFAFLLSPLVNGLCRLGMRQAISVIVVVLFVFSLLGAMIWGFGSQMSSLVYELPDYRQNIREKIVDLRSAGSGSTVERVQKAWRELKGEFKKSSLPAVTNGVADASTIGTNNVPVEVEPVPVILRGQPSPNAWQLPTALGPLVNVLATAGLVIVLVIFMLLRKRELRNRFIVLFGSSRMPTTTRALDEAAERISRYLLMQSILNGSYGLAVGVALYFLGLPYALMWGVLAALLRFIPYVGPWLGASLPILLSLAVFPGWLHPFMVLGLFLVFELFSNMFMEPLLYGQTVGVSEVALITAVAFWTWLWGPIGLALATPLTVCLVVLGKYVPGLSFLTLVMGDEPVMDTPQLFYQRLLAMDDAEAAEIVEEYKKKHELIELYDHLLLPALVSAKRDHSADKLSTEHLDQIIGALGQIITKTAATERELQVAKEAASPTGTGEKSGSNEETREVLGIPVGDTLDELAMSMLANVVSKGIELKSVSAQSLCGEITDLVKERRPSVACIGAVYPGGAAESRYLLKRLQAGEAPVPIVLAHWGLKNEKKLRELAETPGLQAVVTNLKEARNFLIELNKISENKDDAAELALVTSVFPPVGSVVPVELQRI